jgi:hypothetical protein
MATSTKVKFNLEVLKKKALESIDFQIAQAKLQLDSYDNEEAFETRIREWRTLQEERVSRLYHSIADKEISDQALASWRVEPMPESDQWERSRSASNLRSLTDKRNRIVAKSESLVGDEEGNISLTKTQLQEFFGL